MKICAFFAAECVSFTFFSKLFLWLLLIALPEMIFSQSTGFTIQDVKFESQGVTLAGSILKPVAQPLLFP
ncbi:hypothetical protein [Chryseobacterium sp. FH2]|uniref:hypothetical protein n=1 Tax=Chryseobacterium sp. FH2 TaxID=1674291 RepID=UPI000E4192A1|nr:hypothetical protein [Chryseobacterium sp. FH2]